MNSEKEEVVAFVQARMGSQRFPGKMMATINGVPLLGWVLQRTRRAREINKIVLLTTTNSQDDLISDYANELNINVFRGPEEDVLQRFYEASNIYKSKYIVRICADNPLIDPGELDKLIVCMKLSNHDYAFNHRNLLGSKYADGFGAEIIKSTILMKINKLAKTREQREHVTKYIIDNSKQFKIGVIKADKELAHPQLRFDIDTIEDFYYISKLINEKINLETSAIKIIEIATNEFTYKTLIS